MATPPTLVLKRAPNNTAVVYRERCHRDINGVIASDTEALPTGNKVAGGVIVLDAASGAKNKYNIDDQPATPPIERCPA